MCAIKRVYWRIIPKLQVSIESEITATITCDFEKHLNVYVEAWEQREKKQFELKNMHEWETFLIQLIDSSIIPQSNKSKLVDY